MAGLALLALTLTGPVVPVNPGFLLVLVLASISEWKPIQLSVGHLEGYISVTFAMVVAAMVQWGPATAAWLSVLSNLIGHGITHRRPVATNAFNAGQLALSAIGAGLAYRLAGGSLDLHSFSFSNALPLAVYILTHFLINQILANLYINLRMGKFDLRTWSEPIRMDLIVCALVAPLGVLLGYIQATIGHLEAAMVFAPMITVSYIMRLIKNLNAKNQELTVLYEVASRLGTQLDLEKVSDLVLDSLKKTVEYDAAGFFLWDEMNQELNLVTKRHPYPEVLDGFKLPLAQGIAGHVAATRKPELLQDTSQDPRNRQAPGDNLVPRSLLAAPLITEGNLVGVLMVMRAEPGRYTQEHLRVVTILGSQAAVAVQNAMLYRRTEQMAITDPMTGLYNYRYFYFKLGEEIGKARSRNGVCSVLYIDLDNFKSYNDTLGHQAGDEILREFASILRGSVRDSDLPARYAGDEFVVILPGLDIQEAVAVGERIRSAVERHEFSDGRCHHQIRLTVSIGVSTFPSQAEDESALIHQADQAMYRSKAEGNQVRDWAEGSSPG